MATYVVGDIHGCYDAWMRLKNKIEKQDSNARFILVGDIVDRGPKVMEMIDWAMKNITPDGKYQMILGNHEDMKIDWSKQYNRIRKCNFSKTQHYKKFEKDNYDFQDTLIKYDVTDDYVIKIIDFFKSLPVYIDTTVNTGTREQYYIICHAAIPDMCIDKKTGKIIKEKTEFEGVDEYLGNSVRDYIIWERNYYGNRWEAPTIVVHGHTPTCIRDLLVRWALPGKIDFRNKDINVDCGICYGMSVSNLGAICLETLEEFYSEDIDECLFEPFSKTRRNNYKDDMKYFIKTGKEKYETLFSDSEAPEES